MRTTRRSCVPASTRCRRSLFARRILFALLLLLLLCPFLLLFLSTGCLCVYVQEENRRDDRTAVFIFEQLCSVICPAKPEPVYHMILNKSPTQEAHLFSLSLSLSLF